ncbi:hypothetical protein MEA186_01346 [Mesorhizobium amorphae CCNWGS0123]|uniref:Uncharacterized protein n=1 Tax=Mesorhizobium amorphae CCNWGS0123 TaxID=1082933 RepID=G6Y2V3_9HYPH|nr:hypothetical protein A6B35_30965 [Mesorhizobium amorphae CCNWGS0123]EHH13930.1 hypothetical protein MEA186_01346 [Mesorhizobium amorphae CCNWGS0123]
MSVKVGHFNVKDRRAEKQRSRDVDLARLASKQISAKELRDENGFFSSLDRSKARLLVRRASVALR